MLGALTPTEVRAALAAEADVVKVFPASSVGGPTHVKALRSVFPDVVFCPTGGVDAKNAPDYLALPNVICVGGSWVAPADAVRAGDWGRITELARAASQLGKAA